MVLLHLKLVPKAEGSNECIVNLPHEIRSQVLRYKKSYARFVGDVATGTDNDGSGSQDAYDILGAGCVMLDFPFFTGYETTTNTGGGSGQLPVLVGAAVPVGRAVSDTAADVVESINDYHINLKAEDIPLNFTVKAFKSDGVSELAGTVKNKNTVVAADNGKFIQMDLFFEYETANNFT